MGARRQRSEVDQNTGGKCEEGPLDSDVSAGTKGRLSGPRNKIEAVGGLKEIGGEAALSMWRRKAWAIRGGGTSRAG